MCVCVCSGIALRVPTPNVSVVDLVIQTEKKTFAEEVNEAFREYSRGQGNVSLLLPSVVTLCCYPLLLPSVVTLRCHPLLLMRLVPCCTTNQHQVLLLAAESVVAGAEIFIGLLK